MYFSKEQQKSIKYLYWKNRLARVISFMTVRDLVNSQRRFVCVPMLCLRWMLNIQTDRKHANKKI